MSIPQNTIDEILIKSDIIEIISEALPLKQAGRNLKTLCPFHQEKTPSFVVNPDKQIFHCFGCHVGGNVFSFLMKYHNLSFPEAIENLAERYGVTLALESKVIGAVKREDLLKTLEDITKVFEKIFWNGKEAKTAREYLQGRTLSDESIKLFRVGYCPVGESKTLQFFKDKKINMTHLEKLGILLPKGNDRYGVRFRGRIMFPIMDAMGKVVGFGARAMGEEGPKYLNSPESPVFNKSRLFFGLHWAKTFSVRKAFMILTEGYIDVMRLHSVDIKNSVASLGTAFTEQHATIIKRHVNEVVLAYDGDEAGLHGAMRAMEIFLSKDISVKIAIFPEKEDPDSFILNHGVRAFDEMIQSSRPLADFKLDQLIKKYDQKSEAGKMTISKEITDWVHTIDNPILKDEIFRKTSQRMNISEEALRQEYKRNTPRNYSISKENSSNPQVISQRQRAEIEIIRILMEEKGLKDKFRELIESCEMKDPDCNQFLKNILGDKLPSSWDQDKLEKLSYHFIEPTKYKNKEKALLDILNYLKQKGYKEKIAQLQATLSQTESDQDVRKILEKIQEYQFASRSLENLKK